MQHPLMRNNIIRDDLDQVIAHLQQDDPRLTNGENVIAFEKEWSEWLGVKYSVFVNSGASANLLSMALLKLRYPGGGEVIVPTLTWISDIASVLQHGFKPVFVDIDPTTLSMDNDAIIKNINEQTCAVFLSHIQGFNGLSDKLISMLNQRNIPLIEDVCESHGATHKNKKLGSIGWVSNFSFYYAHHMSTIEGGMICTNDEQVYEQARMLRSHGMVREASLQTTKEHYLQTYPELNPDFIFAYPAYNVRNTEIGGILGRSQLKRLDHNIKRRTENFIQFLEQIDSDHYQTDFKVEGSSNYAFNLVLRDADDTLMKHVCNRFQQNGIEFRRGSAGGGNQLRQPYLQNTFPKDYHLQFPHTEHIHFYGLYLGNFPDLTAPEITDLCKIINQI